MSESCEQEEACRRDALYELLLLGMMADPSEFVTSDA